MTRFNELDYVHEWLDTNQAIPPKEPGVYFIYASCIGVSGYCCELLYIGSTKNLRRRLSNHEVLKRHKVVFRITYKATNDYRNLEKIAISRFSPLANILNQKRS